MVVLTTRKRPNWLTCTLEDVEGHDTVEGSSRESNKLMRYYGYVAYMTKLIEVEPSTLKDFEHEEVWKKSMQA